MDTGIIYLGVDPSSLRDFDAEAIKSLARETGYHLVISEQEHRFVETIDRVVVAAGSVPRKRLADAPRLRWFQQFGTGGNWLIPLSRLRQSNVIITNISDNHCESIAEHAFALILALTRQLHFSVRHQTRHAWFSASHDALRELPGQVLLLAGVGSIGRRVAEIASVFGMNMIGLRRNPDRETPNIRRSVAPSQLLEVLPDADIIVNSLPLTSETGHYFDADAFHAMKASAIFINVGRGGTVDESAMIAALRHGRIAGVGLDVFEQEPLQEDSPLWELENVILTGHYAGGSDSLKQRRIDVFIDNLKRFAAGQSLRNVVDKNLCY